MVRSLLIVVLVLAVLVLIGFVMGYNKIRSADIRVAEALSRNRRGADAARGADPEPGAHGADVRRPRKGHPRPRHRCQGRADDGDLREVGRRAQRGRKELDSALVPVLALGESYPQLNSSNNFLNLQDNLADTENKLAFARQYYNDAVAT